MQDPLINREPCLLGGRLKEAAMSRKSPASAHDQLRALRQLEYLSPPVHVTEEAEMREVAEWRALAARWRTGAAASEQTGPCS